LAEKLEDMQRALRRGYLRPMFKLAFFTCVAIVIGVASVVYKATDRDAAAAALVATATEIRQVVQDSKDPSSLQHEAESAVGADAEANGEIAPGSMLVAPGMHFRCRIEWAGSAPQFTGTRIVAMNRVGAELATLTIQDLSTSQWEVETVSSLLFWR
jgi:hypothetical protein